jgi:hypothetical protein
MDCPCHCHKEKPGAACRCIKSCIHCDTRHPFFKTVLEDPMACDDDPEYGF